MSTDKNRLNKWNRKKFLKASVATAGLGLGLFSRFPGKLLQARENNATDLRIESPVKSVIFINLAGGASHVDSLDPKRGNGPFGMIRSSISGAMVSDRLPRLARELKHVHVVRSLYSEEGDHNRASHLLHTGHRTMSGFSDVPSFGAVLAFAKHDANGPYFPEHITLGGRSTKAGDGGFLGTLFDSFHISNPEEPLSNLQPRRTNEASYFRREQLIRVMNEGFAGRVASNETLEWKRMHAAALEFMNSDRLGVFDITRESAAVQRRFGTSRVGKACLLAKRLAEAEAPFIELTVGGWDTHNSNRRRLTELLGSIDGPVAALLGELASSGLLSQTLFVLNSEFGRTPRISSNGDGRDHWPRAWSALIGGGNLGGGSVLGATDEQGAAIVSDAVHGKDFTATIYQASGVDPNAALYTGLGRPMPLVPGANPVVSQLGG